MSNKIHCSFCGKSQSQVKQIIAGPATDEGKSYICNECVEFGYKMLLQETITKRSFDASTVTPQEIRKKLDEYVIGQDYAKMVFSVAIYNHFKRISNLDDSVEIQKSNIMMMGPSGVGKTLLIKTISEALDIPFAMADATSITEAGYVGEDVESIIERLIQNADGDIEKAKHGIIYIDEIDKKVKKTAGASNSRDISGEGVQQALLKIVEGTTLRINGKKFLSEPIDFDTKNILFIVGGAFVGLDSIVLKNFRGATSIGFGATVEKEKVGDIIQNVLPRDLIEYGIIPEFVGRFPILVPMNDLTEGDLINIMTQPKNNIVDQFKAMFDLDGVELEFNEKFLSMVANSCIKQKTGARGLRSFIEKSLLQTQYDLPELRKNGVIKILVGGDGSINHVIEEKKSSKS